MNLFIMVYVHLSLAYFVVVCTKFVSHPVFMRKDGSLAQWMSGSLFTLGTGINAQLSITKRSE